MNEDILEIKKVLVSLQKALLTNNVEEWDKVISNNNFYEKNSKTLHLRICAEIIINENSNSEIIKFLVANYDNDNIRITIDASKNHKRAHIHIGIKKDKYHSISIAINNGKILNSTGNIDNWKVEKVVEWVEENKNILEKIWRCINTWGDVKSAKKHKNKLRNIK